MKDIETLTDLVRGYKELGCNGWVIDYLNRYINGVDTSDRDSTIWCLDILVTEELL